VLGRSARRRIGTFVLPSLEFFGLGFVLYAAGGKGPDEWAPLSFAGRVRAAIAVFSEALCGLAKGRQSHGNSVGLCLWNDRLRRFCHCRLDQPLPAMIAFVVRCRFPLSFSAVCRVRSDGGHLSALPGCRACSRWRTVGPKAGASGMTLLKRSLVCDASRWRNPEIESRF